LKKKPTYMGSKFLNKLPAQIRKEDNPVKFKNLLKAFMVTNVLYSIDEFFEL
jgi:hypothetical protein